MIEAIVAPGNYRSTATVNIDGGQFVAWTETSIPNDPSATPWLPPLTVTAMTQGHALSFNQPVDSAAYAGSLAAQEKLLEWYPDRLHNSEVKTTDTKVAEGAPGRGVGCFFSGGVDSFYTALKHLDSITHFIVIHGLDISLTNEPLWHETVGHIRMIASALGKELIEVKSNVRVLHAKFGPHWQDQAHGAFLAHVGLLLSPHLKAVYIPASDDKSRLKPLGTHPDLDPLWSSDEVSLIHDGVEASRVEKLEYLKSSDVAMKHLRVCWSNLSGMYNCGKCEKCVRTMIGLHIVRASDRCATLPSKISPRAVQSMYLRAGGSGGELMAEENMRALAARSQTDSPLYRALDRSLHRGRLANLAIKLKFYAIDVGFGLIRYRIRQRSTTSMSN
ncbi:hypothetical protein BH683_016370 [Williamsia sp. 1138]|nr:hypothetical protein BH683_016370 [Williamsia sp. 1138]